MAMTACSKSACLSRECLVGKRCTRQITHVFVLLQNYPHLCSAYGEALAKAVMQALFFRLSARGELVAVTGQVFLLAIAHDAASSVTLLEDLLLACTCEPVEYQDVEVLPVVSVGFACVDSSAEAFTRVERCGPGDIGWLAPVQYCFAWRRDYRRDMALALEFVQHLQQGRVFLVFQAVRGVGPRQGELYRESLLRVVAPAGQREREASEFIAALERLGLVRLLDHCVVRAVIALLEADPQLRLGCNISMQSAVGDAWWGRVLTSLGRDRQVAERLTIELTESASVCTGEEVLEFANRLCALGCHLAADDFGAGFSGLGLLLAAQFEVVKLDRRFLQAARLGPAGAGLFDSAVQLCSQLAPQVVVEGVERLEDLVRLEGQPVPLWGQGFFLGVPGQAVRLSLPGPG